MTTSSSSVLEGSVLLSILQNKSRKAWLNKVRPEYFSPKGEKAVLYLYEHPEAELPDVARQFKSASGFLDYLGQDSVRGEAQFDMRVQELRDEYLRKSLRDLSGNITRSLAKPAHQVIQSVERSLQDMYQVEQVESGSMVHALKEWERDQQDREVLKTGVADLDRVTGGHKRGRVWSVGGESGAGKSFFALQMFLLQVYSELNCMFFSTELSLAENVERLRCMYDFFFGEPVEGTINDALISNKNMHIYESLDVAEDIVFEVKRQNRISPVDFVVLDHLQDLGGHENQYERFVDACNKFRRLAIDENVAVLLVSQVNKDGDYLGTRKIRQISHVALILESEEIASPTSKDVYIRVTKNRSGIGGTVPVRMMFPSCSFVSASS